MAKRAADGAARTEVAPPGSRPSVGTSEPKDLLFLDCTPIVSDEYVGSHIASDGTVIFQTPFAIVVANLEDGSVRGRYDPADTVAHGIVENTEGQTGVCISTGDDIIVLSTGEVPEVLYMRTMPPIVQAGHVAVYNSLVFVIKENAVVVIAPFRGEDTVWIAPARVSNIIWGRRNMPIVVTGVEPEDVSLWMLRSEDMAMVKSQGGLEMPVATIAADATTGVGVVAVYPDTGLILVKSAYPAFSDMPILVSPVSATWIGQTLYVLGSASGIGSFPAVYATMPSLGMITGIFHPNKTRFGSGQRACPETNCIRGKYVLWDGQPYMLASTD